MCVCVCVWQTLLKLIIFTFVQISWIYFMNALMMSVVFVHVAAVYCFFGAVHGTSNGPEQFASHVNCPLIDHWGTRQSTWPRIATVSLHFDSHFFSSNETGLVSFIEAKDNAPRIITGRISKNWLPCWSWLAATAMTPAPFMDPADRWRYTLQHSCWMVQGSSSWPLWVDATDLCCLRDLMMIRMMEMVVTTGAIRRAKLQSYYYHQHTNTQLLTGRMDALPVTQPKLSEHQSLLSLWSFFQTHVLSLSLQVPVNLSLCMTHIQLDLLCLREPVAKSTFTNTLGHISILMSTWL